MNGNYDPCLKIHCSGGREYCVGPGAGRVAPLLSADDLERCRTSSHRMCPRLSSPIQLKPVDPRTR